MELGRLGASQSDGRGRRPHRASGGAGSQPGGMAT
jgi:hypothetical protein